MHGGHGPGYGLDVQKERAPIAHERQPHVAQRKQCLLIRPQYDAPSGD